MSQPTAYQFSAFNRLVHTIGSSRSGAWLFSKLQHRFDTLFFRLSGGRRTLTSILAGLPIITLHTIGAKSGQERVVPLVFLYDPAAAGHIGLVASNWGGQRNPGWYYNLKTNPATSGVIRGQTHHYNAHEATTEEYNRIWAEAIALYPGFALYKTRASHRHIPIMILTPA